MRDNERVSVGFAGLMARCLAGGGRVEGRTTSEAHDPLVESTWLRTTCWRPCSARRDVGTRLDSPRTMLVMVILLLTTCRWDTTLLDDTLIKTSFLTTRPLISAKQGRKQKWKKRKKKVDRDRWIDKYRKHRKEEEEIKTEKRVNKSEGTNYSRYCKRQKIQSNRLNKTLIFSPACDSQEKMPEIYSKPKRMIHVVIMWFFLFSLYLRFALILIFIHTVIVILVIVVILISHYRQNVLLLSSSDLQYFFWISMSIHFLKRFPYHWI